MITRHRDEQLSIRAIAADRAGRAARGGSAVAAGAIVALAAALSPAKSGVSVYAFAAVILWVLAAGPIGRALARTRASRPGARAAELALRSGRGSLCWSLAGLGFAGSIFVDLLIVSPALIAVGALGDLAALEALLAADLLALGLGHLLLAMVLSREGDRIARELAKGERRPQLRSSWAWALVLLTAVPSAVGTLFVSVIVTTVSTVAVLSLARWVVRLTVSERRTLDRALVGERRDALADLVATPDAPLYARLAALQILSERPLAKAELGSAIDRCLLEAPYRLLCAAVESADERLHAPPLALLLSAGSRLGRSDAEVALARILGRYGDARAEAELLERLSDGGPEARIAACESLGRVGSVGAIAPLLTTARENLLSPRLRSAAMRAARAIQERSAGSPGALSLAAERGSSGELSLATGAPAGALSRPTAANP